MSSAAASWRRFHLGLRTLLGRRPGGFFIPYRHAHSVRPSAYTALEPLFAAAVPDMLRILEQIEPLSERLRALNGPPPRPRWDQDWFPRLDGATLYAMVYSGRPRRVLEIGSGHSTRFIAQAVLDGGFPCAITCIDPQPRADLARLPIDLRLRLFAPEDAALARELAAGDILVVDSSHVAVAGSDVDLLLNLVMPQLTPGVLVHLHDIFLPDPYPEAWAWRGYNEQVVVAALLHGGGYAIRLASHYLATRHADHLACGVIGQLPLSPGTPESSLWLEKLPGTPVIRAQPYSLKKNVSGR